MRILGLVMITIGFLAGTLIAVIEYDTVDWIRFIPSLLFGLVGVALVKFAMRRAATDATRTTSDLQILRSSIATIVANLHQLNREREALDVYSLPDRIDGVFRADISAFVEARHTIAHVHGIQAYGMVMSHFAAGERYLNRVWSCAADGYIDEAHTYLDRAHEQFTETSTELGKL